MTDPTETIRHAIDEAVEPLINDARTYLASTTLESIPVSRAELHYVFDQYHTQMLDFSADMMPVGHKHPFVNSAVKEHMEYYMRTAPVGDHIQRWPVEYARDIVTTLTPRDSEPVQQVLFTEGEREAVLVAINIARQLAGQFRFKVGVVETGVHGWLHAYDLSDTDRVPVGEFWLKDLRWDKLGAIVMSLVTVTGQVLEPKWVQEVSNTALAHGVPVIIDESLTGFGRFGGNLWGHQRHNVDPDIIVLGGPVGGGLALGAVVAATKQFERVTWGLSPQAGSPVACAAGAGTLRAINPGVLSHIMDSSKTFNDNLVQLVEQFPEYVVATHGLGLWRTLEFQSTGFAHQFVLDARAHGLLVAPAVGSSLVLTPTLIASEMELARGVDLMAEVLLEWYEKDSV